MKGYNFPLAKVITAIASVAATPIKNKLERNETVIKLLEKVGLDPEHPPADFSGVYAYTLVKYGVGKPRQILELFRQKDIKRAFRETFEQDDFLILIKKGQEFIDGYALGDEIKELRVDLLPEFAAFGMVFIDVANSTRTPSEVLRDRKIDTLMRSVSDIQEQISRLKTPKEILLELAIQSQSYQELQPAGESKHKKIGTFILAQQMKGWFEALGYKFDRYKVEENNYFEWIIHIPARRGYDRILVRAVEGEGKLSDVKALQQIVSEQKTIEGWLVASRRISPAVRDKVKKEDNQGIFCYTFDELLDQQADFSKYLDWLEAEVKRKGIDRMYVPLACTKEEFDPITQEKLGVSCYDEDDGWIDGYIDNWLNDRTKEHISILGEFGTGKTWLTLHYAWAALQRYRDAKKRGVERPRIPLVIPLRDYAKAVTVESLFSEFFFRKYEIPLAGYSVFEQLNRMGKLLLIFDGFDEMADRVDSQKMINNFWELAQVVVPGSKAILTCRSEHFPEAKDGRALLNAELEASTSALTGEPPQFEVLELKKFNDDQIRQVLSFRAGASTVNEIMGNTQLLDLARRPVMTELILEALPDIEAGKPVDMSRVYLYAVRTKMERDIKAERTFTSLADKLYFLCELSWEMLSTNQMSLNYRLFPDRLRRLFSHAVQEQKHLDHWHFDMMGQTMLIRNADGDYTPAHRSLLEFFVAYKFAAEIGILAPDFMELAKAQSHLNEVLSSNYTWSSYFSRKCDGKGDIKPVPFLEEFIPETVTLLAETIGKEPLIANKIEIGRADATLKLLLEMISPDKNKVNTRLLSLIKETKGKSSEEVGILGGNIASILIRYDRQALRGQNLAGTKLIQADLSNADLTECNLEYADLNRAILVDTKLVNASLQGVNLTQVRVIDPGWISSIGLGNNSQLNFDYRHRADALNSSELPSGVRDNEVVVTLIEDKQFKWEQKIKSIFFLKYAVDEGVIHLLTIEDRHLTIEIKTGRYLPNEEISLLRKWYGANLADARGLDKRNIYFLRVLGALNLPNTSYNPYKDGGINRALLGKGGQSESESEDDLHP